jgi:hypothetical protein
MSLATPTPTAKPRDEIVAEGHCLECVLKATWALVALRRMTDGPLTWGATTTDAAIAWLEYHLQDMLDIESGDADEA